MTWCRLLLMVLPPTWEVFLSGVNSRETQPDFERLWHDCFQEEGRIQSRIDSSKEENVALTTKKKKGKRFPSRKKFFAQREKDIGGFRGKDFDITKVRCFHCQKKGLFIRNCRKLRKGHKGKFHVDVAEEKETYKKSEEPSGDQETRKDYYLVSTLTDSLKDSVESWLVDSGASRHMTGNKNVLANFKQVQFSSQVELGDDASYEIKGIGSASFQLVWSKDTKLSSTIVIGIKEGGLYKVPGHIQALVHSIASPYKLWHRRFGHLHFKALPDIQKMVRGMPIINSQHNGICKGCMLGKNAKKSFPRSFTRSKEILELIHSDVCGPMSSPSLNGYLYYVIFIDDYSRKTWIYFLKTKGETLGKFQEYKALVEKQTGKNIRALRTDNEG